MSTALSRRWPPIVVAALAATAVAGLGASLTELGPWYYGLNKPWWQPPDWLFGPAWTAIFGMAAASGVLAWNGAPGTRVSRRRIIGLFALNGFLNILWSDLFFRLHRPDWALAEVGFLWLSILLLIVTVAPASRKAAWLLVPYLLRVGFAAVLNLAVVRMNYPFQ